MTGDAATFYLTAQDIIDDLSSVPAVARFKARLTKAPAADPAVMKTPGLIAFVSVGGGAGLTREMTFDRPFITLRIVGPPQNFDVAESFAMTLDAALLRRRGSEFVNKHWTLYTTRSGGRPALMMKDNGERYHFTASYVTEVESGF